MKDTSLDSHLGFLNHYARAHLGKEVFVTSQASLPPDIQKLAPKMALTDGKRIYLPSLGMIEYPDEQKRLQEYKRMCVEKALEIRHGYHALPETERPTFEGYKNSQVASTLYQLLENESYHLLAQQELPGLYRDNGKDHFIGNMFSIADHLPKKNAKKLAKKAMRYQRLVQSGKASPELSAKYTQQIYDCLDLPETKEEETKVDPELMRLLSLFLGPGGSCSGTGPYVVLPELLAQNCEGREKLKESALKYYLERNPQNSEEAPDKLETAVDAVIQNRIKQNCPFEEYTDLVSEALNELERQIPEQKRLINFNPNDNPKQTNLQFNVYNHPISPIVDYEDLIRPYYGIIQNLKQKFEQLVPKALAKRKRQTTGNDLDLEAAIDFMTQVKMGRLPDCDVYVDTVRKERDVYIGMLLDLSGSMGGGNKIVVLRQSTAVLSEVLDSIGDNFSTIGFTGDNPRVDMYLVKDHSEKFDSKVKNRIASLRALSQNRDGAAIRWTTDYLLQTPHKTNILFVISDGVPYDHGYSGDSALDDTREALLEAKSRGVNPFCLTLDSSHAQDYLKKLYGPVGYSICQTVEELPKAAAKVYERIAF